ncbi:hypothetical protein CSUB01_11644 [Colletotrichum sublineola]|uniref:Uncharacterized protein n=1 Tax=Colletotrichum sublineola TaxID=1173701 RepID=A0A066XMM4_COLSU|nr:hypothetical protein CSUB01_11644 [Colletotrichum sublineola]
MATADFSIDTNTMERAKVRAYLSSPAPALLPLITPSPPPLPKATCVLHNHVPLTMILALSLYKDLLPVERLHLVAEANVAEVVVSNPDLGLGCELDKLAGYNASASLPEAFVRDTQRSRMPRLAAGRGWTRDTAYTSGNNNRED